MFVHYRTRGIILAKKERGESDLLLTIYTENFGKLEILGRAIRKINSKLRPSAEIFCLSDVEFIQGKVNKTLTDAVLIDKFLEIKNNFLRIKIARRISETLDNFIKGQELDEKIWELLAGTFRELNSSGSKSEIIYHYFFWNFISLLGYAPELCRCVACQNKLLPEKFYFSAKESGLICQNCSKGAQLNQDIGPDAVKILRLILKMDWPEFFKIKINENHLNSLRKISKGYYFHLCGKLSSF